MKELLNINNHEIGEETVNSVDARELYETLQIKKDFADWMRHQVKSLSLDKNIDYISFKNVVKRDKGASMRIEYILTTDTAEHIAMASRTQKGKEIRRWFIDLKKEHLKSLESKTYSDEEVQALKSTILEQNKIIAASPKPAESDVFMNDPSLHNHFLDFLYQANKVTHEVNCIRHLSSGVDTLHQSMSNFMLHITRRYEKIRGVSQYKMPKVNKVKNNYILEEIKSAN